MVFEVSSAEGTVVLPYSCFSGDLFVTVRMIAGSDEALDVLAWSRLARPHEVFSRELYSVRLSPSYPSEEDNDRL